MKVSIAVSRLVVIVLAIGVVSTAAHAQALRRIALGDAVSSWSPVDIDADGTWELAIHIAGNPARVGLFDPQSGSWISGPYELPVTDTQWGIADYDGDGQLEYAYKVADSIMLFEPGTGEHELLWTVPEGSDGTAIFWGRDSARTPLVGVVVLHGWADTTAYGQSSGTWYSVEVFSVMTGDSSRTLPGGPGPYYSVYNPRQESSVNLVMHRFDGNFSWSSYQGMTQYDSRVDDDVLVISDDWVVQSTSHLYDLNSRYSYLYMFPKLNAVAGLADGAGGMAYLLCLFPVGLGNASLYGYSAGAAQAAWSAANDHYDGMAAFDLYSSGTQSWVLPLIEPALGWEIRDLESGVVTDTLQGLPAADLHTGPLFEAGVADLFYFADSGLYIWGLTTDVTDQDTPQAPVPRNLTLTAYPNPFNASVSLTWNGNSSAGRLDIFNILGQRVRSYDFDPESGISSVEWNGQDQSSAPVPSGVYFARLTAQDRTAITKIVLLK